MVCLWHGDILVFTLRYFIDDKLRALIMYAKYEIIMRINRINNNGRRY